MRHRFVFVLSAAVIGLITAGTVWADTAPCASNEESAIRKDVEAYAASYNKGDIDAVGRHWTPDAEYINDEGKVLKGRDAIVALFKKGRVATKGYTFGAAVQSVRLIKPDVALEDGTVTLTAPDGTAQKTRFSAVLIKTAGAWQLSHVQDIASLPESGETSPAARLKQLEWMLGKWDDEDKSVSITMTCRWAPGKSFLLQEYTIKRPDGDIFEVTQRVGWDPTSERIRSWIFDSKGGFSEGVWQRNGNQWEVAVTGILPDARTASARQVWSFVDDKHFKWQSLDREIDSHPLVDTLVTFQRAASSETAASESKTH